MISCLSSASASFPTTAPGSKDSAKHHLRTDRSLTLSEDLPLVAVDARARIEAMLPEATRLT
jgi:hypothetical protein